MTQQQKRNINKTTVYCQRSRKIQNTLQTELKMYCTTPVSSPFLLSFLTCPLFLVPSAPLLLLSSFSSPLLPSFSSSPLFLVSFSPHFLISPSSPHLLLCLHHSSSPPPTGPSPLKSIHCFPLSSSSLSCSWSPPLSDFDSYEVECRRHDNGELTSALRLAGGVTAVTLDHLDAYRKYSVTVRVSSAGQTSPPATHTTVTMIDREFIHTHAHTLQVL